MVGFPKRPPLRDRGYLDWLRTQPCIITGLRATEYESVDPAHLGVSGKGIKSPDNNAIPLIHHIHAYAHRRGHATMFRERAPDWLIMKAFKALAEDMYEEWQNGPEGR